MSHYRLRDVLRYKRKLKPLFAGPFMDMIAETERQFAAGKSYEDIRAQVMAVGEPQGQDPNRDAFAHLLACCTLDFLDKHR